MMRTYDASLDIHAELICENFWGPPLKFAGISNESFAEFCPSFFMSK